MKPPRWTRAVVDPATRTVPMILLSLATLPVLASQAWTQTPGLRPDPSWTAERPGGEIRAYRIRSDILAEERRVFVALPPSHPHTARPYPVILVLDGEALAEVVTATTDALVRVGHMPEVVVVGIENTDRLRDLSPPGLPVSGNDGAGRADRFLDFLADELQPALATAFRASGPVTLVGHSSGGLFVHYALSVRPGRFPAGLALDAPMHLGDGDAVGLLATQPRAGPRTAGSSPRDVPLRLVSIEARFGWPDDDWDALVATAPAAWTLYRESLPDESHGSMTWPGCYRGLKRLFDDYSTVASSAVPPVDRLARFDAAVPADPALPPPASLLRQVAEDRIGVRDLELAAATIGRLITGYGESSATETLQGRLAEAEDTDIEGPTLTAMRAAPSPSPDAVAPLVGEWQGTSWTEGARTRTPLRVSVRIEDGQPVGEIAVGHAPPRAIEYMTAAGDTFHVGYMNGMRPRGMLVYEGTIDGDVYQGTFALRGVVFRLPDGRALPTTRFLLRRVDG